MNKGSDNLSELFRQLTMGVYVVGVTDGKRCNAFTAAWVMQVSFDPTLLALSINPRHSSYKLLTAGRSFSINVLRRDQIDLARHFGGPGKVDKLAAVKWSRKCTGAPILEDVVAYFDCELSHRCPAGDHELVIGRVVDGEILNPGVRPLSYAETGDMDSSARLYPDRF